MGKQINAIIQRQTRQMVEREDRQADQPLHRQQFAVATGGARRYIGHPAIKMLQDIVRHWNKMRFQVLDMPEKKYMDELVATAERVALDEMNGAGYSGGFGSSQEKALEKAEAQYEPQSEDKYDCGAGYSGGSILKSIPKNAKLYMNAEGGGFIDDIMQLDNQVVKTPPDFSKISRALGEVGIGRGKKKAKQPLEGAGFLDSLVGKITGRSPEEVEKVLNSSAFKRATGVKSILGFGKPEEDAASRAVITKAKRAAVAAAEGDIRRRAKAAGDAVAAIEADVISKAKRAVGKGKKNPINKIAEAASGKKSRKNPINKIGEILMDIQPQVEGSGIFDKHLWKYVDGMPGAPSGRGKKNRGKKYKGGAIDTDFQAALGMPDVVPVADPLAGGATGTQRLVERSQMPGSSMSGFGKSKPPSKWLTLVKKVCADRKCTVKEAIAHIKANNLYKK